MPRLAFAVGRRTSYRTLGAVIEAALADPFWEVELVLGPLIPAGGWKAYQNPTPENVPARLRGRCAVAVAPTPADIRARLRSADAVVADVGRSFLTGDESESVEAPLWCAVFDADHATNPTNRFRHAAVTCWPTGYYVEWAKVVDPAAAEALARSACDVGYVRADGLRLSSRSETRREWKLPLDRPIVLYVPDGYRLREMPTHTTSWYRRVWCGDRPLARVARTLGLRRGESEDEAAMLRALRAFCDANGAALVLMPRREKNRKGRLAFTRDEIDVADFVIPDDVDYPQTLPRAAQMADLVVCSYRSGALLDVLAAGVPYITVAVPPEAYTETVQRYHERFDRNAGHHPGAVWVIPANELIRDFGARPLSDFSIDPDVLAAVRERYVGPVDGECARRVLDAITRRLVAAAR
jgi:hypothetical protein